MMRFLCASLAVAAVYAQQTGTVFRSDTRLVVLNTTVEDRDGRLVTDLSKEAFTVYENGARQQIRIFHHEDVPVSLGLIIDSSASMRDKRAKVEAASLVLVEASNREDEVFVVNFNDEAYLDLPHGKAFTNDRQELKEALGHFDARGGTAMRDAIDKSLDHLKLAHRDKKVLVVVTDGDDNWSTISQESLVRKAQQSGVLIYSVGLLTAETHASATRARRSLVELAEATGGRSFFPKDVSEVDRIAHQVARDIRSQYTISYTPSNDTMDGTYRRVKVSVNAPGHPTAHTRSGYYATPDRIPAAAPVASR